MIDVTEESADPFEFLLDVTRRYGDSVQWAGPLGKTYLLNSPDYVRHVLHSPQFHRTSLATIVLGEGMLSSDGECSRKQRQQALPFFHRNALEQFQPLIKAHTRAMLERWDSISERGEALDVSAEMAELTLSIIVDALFGVELRSQMSELGQALDVLLNDVGAMGCTQLNTPLSFSESSLERFRTALATLDRIVWEIIDERRRLGNDSTNLLSYLLSVRDEETGRPLTDRQLRDQVATFLIAGHETTSLVLSWAWHLLAENPSTELCLHQELDRVIGTRTPNLEDLDDLPYALMVLRESMRLYPPVWFMARKSLFAGDVGGTYVPENVLVVVSPYALHRHPGFWENPDDFDPLRFSPGTHQSKNSYIPFASGHHQCIGMNLALMEGHLILASVAQHYRIRPLADHAVEPQPAITLRLRTGLMANLLRRAPERVAK